MGEAYQHGWKAPKVSLPWATLIAAILQFLLLAYSYGKIHQHVEDIGARLERIERYIDLHTR